MSERLSNQELFEALEIAQGMRSMKLMAAIAELRERRSADLTDEERDALAKLLGETRDEAVRLADFSHHAVAMKALTKLIGASK